MKKALAMFLFVVFIPCFVSADSSMTDEEYVHAYFLEFSDEELYALNLATQIELDSRGISTSETGLSSMTYDELVMLKDRINIAIWNSQEWQEVEVPQGVWKIGEDIPVGHWTITASPTAWVGVTYGSELDDNQKEIDWLCKGYYHELLKGKKHVFATEDDLRSIDINTKNGYYIEIEDGSVIFTPYSGKPSLGFK